MAGVDSNPSAGKCQHKSLRSMKRAFILVNPYVIESFGWYSDPCTQCMGSTLVYDECFRFLVK